MMDLARNSQALLALGSGVTLHHLFYRLSEWDTRSPFLLVSYISALVAGSVGIWLLNSRTEVVPFSPNEFRKFWLYHILGVYSSMLVYRGFFHRLGKFPGPFLARFSNLYLTMMSSKLHLYEEIGKLHETYGDYVRTGNAITLFLRSILSKYSSNLGPTELSITDPAAVQAIYSIQSKATKGPWYTLLDPRVCLSFTRDKQEHARRRKVWDRGFSTKGNISYLDHSTKNVH